MTIRIIGKPPLFVNYLLYSSIFNVVLLRKSVSLCRPPRLRRAAPMAPKRMSQLRITASLFPEVKRPIKLVGKFIGVPRAEWGSSSGRFFGVGGGVNATIFKCVLRDHMCVDKFPNAVSPEKAWQLQETDVSGSVPHPTSRICNYVLRACLEVDSLVPPTLGDSVKKCYQVFNPLTT